MFLEFDFRWGPFYKNTPSMTFDFHPSRVTRGALGVRSIKKLHKTENDWRPI